MKTIVKSKNDFYVKVDTDFYGPFHSVSEAEQKNSVSHSFKTKPLTDFNIVKGF